MSPPSCGSVRSRLSAFLDDDLHPEALAEIRAHLDGCAACRAELDSLRLTVAALRRLPHLPPPAGILAGVRARLSPEPWHEGFLRRARRNWLYGIPIGALATLLVVVGAAFFQARFSEPRRQTAREEVPGPRAALTGGVPVKEMGATQGREPLEILYVWSQDGDDVEELRRILQREGGNLLEVRAMDSRTGREAIIPLQRQMIPASDRVRNAWEIQAKIPRRNLDRFVDDVQQRPGYQLLQRRPAELPMGPALEHQDVRITLFR